MIYAMLAVLVYLLFCVPRLTQDLPYVQYQPKNAQIAERDRQVINRAVLWFTLGFLILFAGLRDYETGFDLRFYYKEWRQVVESNGAISSYEWLYKNLMRICFWLVGAEYGFTFVLIVCAAIIVLCVYFAGRITKQNVGLLMFFMVACVLYLRGFSTVRQCVAASLCALATSFIYRRKKVPELFILCIVFASGFHLPTAILFIPMVVFSVFKSNFWQILIWVEAVFLGLVFLHFDNKVVQIFGTITGKDYYYRHYMAGAYGVFDWKLMDTIECILALLSFVGFFVYKCWYNMHYHERVNRQYDLFLNVYFFAILFYLLALISPQYYVYERLTVPFSWAGIFLITNIISNIKQTRVRLVIQIIAMTGALAYTLALVYLGKHAIIPYYTISDVVYK